MGRFMVTNTKIKKPKKKRAKRRCGLSIPIYQSRSQSTNEGHSDSSYRTPLHSDEEDFEPLPHGEEDSSSIINDCEFDKRSVKKHRSNDSWNPIGIVTEDDAIVDWLSSAFGETGSKSSEEAQ